MSEGQVVAQVTAGAEGVVDPGDHGHPRVRIVAEALPRVGEGVEVLQVEGVAPRRTVDGDGDDVVDASARLRRVVDRHALDGIGLR